MKTIPNFPGPDKRGAGIFKSGLKAETKIYTGALKSEGAAIKNQGKPTSKFPAGHPFHTSPVRSTSKKK